MLTEKQISEISRALLAMLQFHGRIELLLMFHITGRVVGHHQLKLR